MIRNNEKIVSDLNLDDYKNFGVQGVKRENIQNIILSFKNQFTDFSNEIYEKALGGV